MAQQQDDIEACQFRGFQSKGFTAEAFDAVTVDSLFGLAAADNEAQAGVIPSVFPCQQQEAVLAGTVIGCIENSLELVRLEQTVLSGKGVGPHQRKDERRACAVVIR